MFVMYLLLTVLVPAGAIATIALVEEQRQYRKMRTNEVRFGPKREK